MQPKTPNVYVQEKSIFPPSVAEVATAIPAFVGRTEVAVDGADESLVGQPIRITSMVEYERWFGGPYLEGFNHFKLVEDDDGVQSIQIDKTKKPAPVAKFILYHCVYHFFANGGGACYVVSTGSYQAHADGQVDTATEVTEFGTALDAIQKVDEVTLLVVSDAAARMQLSGAYGTDGVFKPDDQRMKYYSICNKAIAQCVEQKERFALVDVVDSTMDEPEAGRTLALDLTSARTNLVTTNASDMKYAAAYYPYLRTTIPRSYDESKVIITLPMPSPPADSDTTPSVQSSDTTPPTATMASFSGTAIYAELKNLLGSQYMVLPPSASMAGIYAGVDSSRGVWKAPANVAVRDVVGPVRIIDNATQENMNVDSGAGKSINAIRSFSGKGTLVWGARTLAGNDNEWRYVPVRRLFNMVEESVQKATGFAVFEPNTPFTWLKLKTMIESYLENLWRQGALFGETKEMAYFVNVGLGQTMTEADINNGLMKIEIGLAAVRPAEFIILTFSHKSLEG